MIKACGPKRKRSPQALASSYYAQSRRAIQSTARSAQQAPSKRYGSAIEPLSQQSNGKASKAREGSRSTAKKSANDVRKPPPPSTAAPEAQSTPPQIGPPLAEAGHASNIKQIKSNLSESKTDPPTSSQGSEPPLPSPDSSEPLATVLHMAAPSSTTSQAHRPPHLQAPPYVHHFDTYTLVRALGTGGYTQEQAVTAMKAVRALLAENLELAKEGLVSKSDVENETYLFQAACSELRTEIKKNRAAETEQMRTQRTHLQHEIDILNQKMTQDLLTLKEDLKGMFNDRKMAVSEEQRGMGSSIQELNYKITVSLNSDAKSDVEGLRWVLTRRAAMAIVTMAFLILGSLRASSWQLQAQEASHHGKTSSSGGDGPQTSVSHHHDSSGGIGSNRDDRGARTEELANSQQGSNPIYVSLG
ncbi:MAG: hypothetical protein M1825_000633 [Sarcosagium campestre]|nr:MAG: hypothetical protein M1825_000633 [Sarcosagium campestre]